MHCPHTECINSQQSNTYQYPTDKKVRKLFEVPTYYPHIYAWNFQVDSFPQVSPSQPCIHLVIILIFLLQQLKYTN